MVSERIQKKRESANVAHSKIISVIILVYSFIGTSFSEAMLTSCGAGHTVNGHKFTSSSWWKVLSYIIFFSVVHLRTSEVVGVEE